MSGSNLRPVPRPAGSPRGGLLTQGAILKVTANGTTTSPVKRGAWVMTRLLGEPPPQEAIQAPPPPQLRPQAQQRPLQHPTGMRADWEPPPAPYAMGQSRGKA